MAKGTPEILEYLRNALNGEATVNRYYLIYYYYGNNDDYSCRMVMFGPDNSGKEIVASRLKEMWKIKEANSTVSPSFSISNFTVNIKEKYDHYYS